MTPKDTKIIADAEKTGTPIFVLTAKDQESLKTLMDYSWNCQKAGCDPSHIDGIANRIKEFSEWQRTHANNVKRPD
jgi:PHP family Zn ribbon phosphoesterase